MKIIRTVAELRDHLASDRRAGRTIGLVPTMGSFHAGHVSLMTAARSCDVVVVSLFVNPTQFGEGEDLAAYPRDEGQDAQLAAATGVDILFAPSPEEVYPPGFATTVRVEGITEVLCGDPQHRGPQHFAGVTQVVTKLLNMVQPDVAYFGQKDIQQVLVIRRMVRDLNFPVLIETCPTVREPDGLAMSSRNIYLAPHDRQRATAINRSLQAVADAATAGERDCSVLLDKARIILSAAGITPEYIELRATDDLAPLVTLDRPAVIAVAARVGSARLIDNHIIDVS